MGRRLNHPFGILPGGICQADHVQGHNPKEYPFGNQGMVPGVLPNDAANRLGIAPAPRTPETETSGPFLVLVSSRRNEHTLLVGSVARHHSRNVPSDRSIPP